jgi:predicted metal-dependent enzyme (double-stranded beta helix superfamily)
MAGLQAFQDFVAALRVLHAARLPDHAHWKKVGDLLGGLLRDASFRDHSRGWPVCGYENLVLHHDQDYGFVVNGLVRGSHHKSPPHDHAHTWTVYGVLDGIETITKFERADDGRNAAQADLRQVEQFDARPGDVHVLAPGLIHTETNGEGRVVAIVVRSDKVGDVLQNAFDPATGAIKKITGPKQVPYELT